MRTSPVKVFFDGAARPNPGPMALAVVARGQVMVRAGPGEGSNGDAEWLALLAALEIARDLGLRDVVLLGDSAFVIDHAAGGGRSRAACARYLERLADMRVAFARVRLRRIARAQNLAGIALDRALDNPRGFGAALAERVAALP